MRKYGRGAQPVTVVQGAPYIRANFRGVACTWSRFRGSDEIVFEVFDVHSFSFQMENPVLQQRKSDPRPE